MFTSELAWLRRQSIRGLLAQCLTVLTVLSTSLALYKGLSCLVDSESPVVVVLSGSMEPAFYRGDLLLLSMPSEKLKVGDIVVYNTVYGGTPIVHRILETHDEWVGRGAKDEPTAKFRSHSTPLTHVRSQLRRQRSAHSHKGRQQRLGRRGPVRRTQLAEEKPNRGQGAGVSGRRPRQSQPAIY